MKCAAGMVLVVFAATAHADPAAEQLFQNGKKLIADGKLDEGCDLIQRSADVEQRVGTLLNLGKCREQQGRIALAWEAFVAAKALAARQKDDRGAEAERKAGELKPRLAYLTVKVSKPPEGTVVVRDGQPLPPALFDQPIPVDPAPHTIEATAPGHQPWKKEVALTAGMTTAVEIALVPVAGDGPTPPRVVDGPKKISPPLGRGAIGVGFGSTSSSGLAFNLRGIVGLPVTGGAIRLSVGVGYAHLNLSTEESGFDPDNNQHIFSPGGAVDYFAAYRPGLAFAAGVGIGLDVGSKFYDNFTTTQAWIGARVSPIVFRLSNPRFEVGLHLSFVTPQNMLVGLVGLDWFP